MKLKMSVEKIRVLALAIIVVAALWQVSIGVQAQKVEKSKTAHPASVNSADKKPAANKTDASPNNAEYAAKVKEYTTEPYFMTELVDHLRLSPGRRPLRRRRPRCARERQGRCRAGPPGSPRRPG